MDDLPIRYASIRDENRIEVDGSVIAEKVARIYIGLHGPFVERFPAATFTVDQVGRRAEDLRREIQALPT